MMKETQRRLDMCERAYDLAGKLTLTPAGASLVEDLASVITLVKQLARDQVSNRGNVSVGAEARAQKAEELRGVLRIIARVAQKLDPAGFPNVAELFQTPKRDSYQSLLATARAFERDMAPIKEEFARQLSAPFVDLLPDLITQFETGTARKHAALNEQVTSTRAMHAAAMEGVALVRALDPIVRVALRGNNAQLTAWKLASHVRRKVKTEEVPASNGAPAAVSSAHSPAAPVGAGAA